MDAPGHLNKWDSEKPDGLIVVTLAFSKSRRVQVAASPASWLGDFDRWLPPPPDSALPKEAEPADWKTTYSDHC